MKLDKDTLVKHQFWVLLGSFLFLWLIAVLWDKVSAGEPIETSKKNYDGSESKLKTAKNNPVNTATFLPPWNEAADIFNAHKNKIWKDAWDHQVDMFDWPPEWTKTKDMTTPQTELNTDDLFNYKDTYYPRQIKNFSAYAPQWLKPVELTDGFDAIFQPKRVWKNTPTREEVWLAQEDFWVKRELCVVIYQALDDLARMQPKTIDDKEKKPEGVEVRYRCANQNWEITLNLRRKDGKKDGPLVIGGDSTITNLDPNHRAQPLTDAKGRGIFFSVAQDRFQTPLEVKGEPVGWNETRAFSMNKDNEREDYKEPLDGIDWNKINERPISVSQGFDLTNSPIRSIRKLALGQGAQDCRTFCWPLQPNQALAKLDALPEDANAKPAAGGAPAPGGPGGMQRSPAGGMNPGGPGGMKPGGPMNMNTGSGRSGGQDGSAEGVNLTPNNEMERNRYLRPPNQDKNLNPPSRHLPLALRLVVMQSHMHDVLLALANSRLRIQITQVEFHHAKDYKPQRDGEPKDGTDNQGYRRTFMGSMPGMSYSDSARMGPGRPPGMPGVPPNIPGNPMGMGGSSSMGGRSGMRMPGQMMDRPPMMGPPGMNGPGGQGKFRPNMAPGMRRSGNPQAPNGSDTTETVQNPQDDNLVDITIYGISTLYRRPDPPKTSEQPGRPEQPQPGRPGGQKPAPPTPPVGKKP
ncbi:MAG: hypothetical protein ACRELG_24055 [Gemmataceae bacterium]